MQNDIPGHAEFFTDYWLFGVFDSNDLNENR